MKMNASKKFLTPSFSPKQSSRMQNALSGAGTDRPILWPGLQLAIDSIAGQGQTTTEEAFNLLTRFGQVPSDGKALEIFAKSAERVVAISSPTNGMFSYVVADRGSKGRRTPAATVPDESGGGDGQVTQDPDKREEKVRGSQTHDGQAHSNAAKDKEAQSVWLNASDISKLAAEFDPLRHVDSVFASLENSFPGISADHRHRVQRRSPLQVYALNRRSRRWRHELEVASNALETLKLKLGRRGLDILLGEPGSTAARTVVSRPSPEVSAAELITEAEALASTIARRQTNGRDEGHLGRIVLTAQAHHSTILPERTDRGVRAFDGWGYYEHVGIPQDEGRKRPGVDRDGDAARKNDAGEPVAVLQISMPRAREAVNAEGSTFGEHATLSAALLSVPALREHKGLLHFHPGAKVLLGECGNIDSGGGDSAGGGSPLHLVTERLGGWRPLCDVIRERGPVTPSSEVAVGEDGGLRVLRLWGRQLVSILARLGSRSLVLRNMSTSTVFVSPDGSTLKVVGLSGLATLSPDGTISRAAPSLDHDVHGTTRPITPPEALMMKKTGSCSGIAGLNTDDTLHVGHELLILAAGDNEQPTVFPATAAWDVWTLGVLLFELAYGREPPAYGASLGQAVSLFKSTAVAGVPRPALGEIASALQYDFLSAIDGSLEDLWAIGSSSTGSSDVQATRPLTQALECMSLGTVMRARDRFQVDVVGVQKADVSHQELRGEAKESLANFRRVGVRQQLEMEARGEVGGTTWQMLEDKVKGHLHIVASAAQSSKTKVVGGQEAALAADAGGGRSLPRDDPGGSSEKAAEVETVEKIIVLLREADSRGTGWVPFRAVRRALESELLLSLSSDEAAMITVCLQNEAIAYDYNESARKAVGVSGEDMVFYPPLKHLLHSCLSSFLDSRTACSSDLSPSPRPATFVELLCMCMEPNPIRRPSPEDLLLHSFLSGGNACDEVHISELDYDAAAAYMSGASSDDYTLLSLRDGVERPIQELEKAVSSHTGMPNASTRLRRSGNSSVGVEKPADSIARVGAETLVAALRELDRLVRPTAAQLYHVADSQQSRKIARGHSKVVDEVFKSGVLMRASALSLRYLEQDEVRVVKFSGWGDF